MSDHDSEMTQPETESAWQAASAFSSNGSDPGDGSMGTDERGEADLDDRTKFLSDLARVMQTTVAGEQSRNTEATDARLKAHLDSIRAREALVAEELRELAKEDVKGIDAWSEGEIKRIKLERERRIASRREQLQIRLEEHRAVIAREVAAVDAAVAGYREQMDEFFGRLELETDPVAIASYAGTQPIFPDLTSIGIDDVQPIAEAQPEQPADYGYVVNAAPVAEEQVVEAQVVEEQVGPEALQEEPVQELQAQEVPQPEPVEQQFVAEEPRAEQPQFEAAQAQEAEQPVAEQAVAEQPVAEQSQAAEQPVAEQPVAEQPVADQPSAEQPQGDVIQETPLVGVMDPGAGDRSAESPWEPGVGAAPVAAVASEPVQAEGQASADAGDQEQAQGDAGEQVGEPETVAAAEAHVVMPRSSGAGSWLRWPTSSVDRSDPGE
jgi:hypothetical protein